MEKVFRILDGDNIYSEIEKMISGARKSVKIASAWLKGSVVERIVNILEKKGEGIEVEVILRGSEFRDLLITDDKVFKQLKKIGTKIYLNNRLHAKFVIVDDEKMVIGSANFTESGLSDYSRGNIEVAVYYETNNNSESSEISRLISYFDKIKKDRDTSLVSDKLVGFVLNPAKTDSFEFVLLRDDLEEQSYVKVKDEDKIILAKIVNIYSYDMGFFANPFSNGDANSYASVNHFELLFASNRDEDWKKAAVRSYLNENGRRIKIAVARVVGEISPSDGKLEASLKPFNVGAEVFKVSSSDLDKLLKTNFNGSRMREPVEIGHLEGNRDVRVFVDFAELSSRHMAVLGTTGSGKSYFTKLLIKRIVETTGEEIEIFILDPHGEYKQELISDFKVDSSLIEEKIFDVEVFPIYADDFMNLLKENGYGYLISAKDASATLIKSEIQGRIRPSLKTYDGKNLKSIIEEIEKAQEANQKNKKDKKIYNLESLKEELPGGQDKVVTYINELIDSENNRKVIKILNLRKITDPKTRINIAGLFMAELFKKNKEDRKRRLLLLEEAHNFASERGTGDVSADSTNLSLKMAARIATEGRKFNLGLILVSQRPAQVSKTVLSQANTQMIFRIMNSSDLASIENALEFSSEEIVSLLPLLRTGSGVVSGVAVPFTMLVRVS